VNGETSVGFAGDPIQGYGDYYITVDMQTNWFEVVH
jgi:hypothetical protein